jgi:hypothetical protein
MEHELIALDQFFASVFSPNSETNNVLYCYTVALYALRIYADTVHIRGSHETRIHGMRRT